MIANKQNVYKTSVVTFSFIICNAVTTIKQTLSTDEVAFLLEYSCRIILFIYILKKGKE